MKAFMLLFCLLILLSGRAKSVTIIPNPTAEMISTIYGSGAISWTAYGEVGYMSTLPNVTLTANSGQSVHHDWHSPEQISLEYDGNTGNLSYNVGSTELVAQPTSAFNTLVIRLGENAIFGQALLDNIEFDGVSLRQMIADDLNSGVITYDYLVIAGINPNDGFQLTAAYTNAANAAGAESNFSISGYQTTAIPEPSAVALLAAGLAMLLRRRSRH